MNSIKENQIERPWIINVELTNACNLECIFCDHRILKKKMKIREMDDSLLIKILKDVKNNFAVEKIHEFGLVGLGEPTLDRQLETHLNIINDYADIFERVSLNSNIVALGEKQAEILMKSKVNVYTFSVNASNKELYFVLTGKNYFEDVIENLNYFIGLLKKKHYEVKIGVQIFESPENDIDELKQKLPEARGMQIHYFYRKVYSKPVIPRSTELITVYPASKQRYPCWDVYTRIYIDVNGYLYPCTIGNDCYREKSNLCLGSVYDSPVFDLFNNEKINTIREVFEKGGVPFPECGICNLWSITPNNFDWDQKRRSWRKKDRPVRSFRIKV